MKVAQHEVLGFRNRGEAPSLLPQADVVVLTTHNSLTTSTRPSALSRSRIVTPAMTSG